MSVLKAVLNWHKGYWRPFVDVPQKRQLEAWLGSAEYEFASLSRDLAKVAIKGSRLQEAVIKRPRG